MVQTHEGNDGRWLAEIWIPGFEDSINGILIREGLAFPHE